MFLIVFFLWCSCCAFHNRVCGTLRYEIIFAFTFNELLAGSASPLTAPALFHSPLLAFMDSCSVISYKWLDRSIDNEHVQHASVEQQSMPHATCRKYLGQHNALHSLWFSVP